MTKPAIEEPGYLGVLKAKQVAPGTYARIAKGRVLGYGDIKELVVKDVPGGMIVAYLKATRVPYRFSAKAINGLVDAGADATLVNYLGKAAGIYLEDGGNAPSSTGGWRNHPYFNDMGYLGSAPFDFAFPEEWYGAEWAD
jgi:hypothetical protein